MLRRLIGLAMSANVSLTAGAAYAQRTLPQSDSAQVFSGVYFSTYEESLFSPCDVAGIGSGWWLRFATDRSGAFLRYQYSRPGMPPLQHFVRVRGRVSGPGHYGRGFETREILVDSVLEIKESPQPCASYEDVPRVWTPIKTSSGRILAAAVTDDRKMLGVLDDGGTVRIWDASRASLLRQFRTGDTTASNTAFRTPMVFSHNGRRLAIVGLDGAIRVWNPQTGKRLRTFAPHDTLPGTVNGKKVLDRSHKLGFNQSGSLLATTSSRGVSIWSLATGKRISIYNDGAFQSKLVFTGDRSFLASGAKGVLNAYDRFGSTPQQYNTPLTSFQVMELSPRGNWLFMKSWSDTAYLWSVEHHRLAHVLPIPTWFGHGAIAFSPDERILVTTGGNNALYLWDTKTGAPIRSVQKFPSIVEQVWFTPDGKSLVAHAMWDSVLRKVDLDVDSGRQSPSNAAWGNFWPLRLPPSGHSFGSIVGFVRDAANKPIIGAQVLAFNGDIPGSPAFDSATTNAAGRYLIQNVKVPHVTVRAGARDLSPSVKFTHLPASEVDVSFTLGPRQ